MPTGNDFNNQQLKQQAQYLNMRGAQIAQQKSGQKTELGSQPKEKGSRKQLFSVIIGTIPVFVMLTLLLCLTACGGHKLEEPALKIEDAELVVFTAGWDVIVDGITFDYNSVYHPTAAADEAALGFFERGPVLGYFVNDDHYVFLCKAAGLSSREWLIKVMDDGHGRLREETACLIRAKDVTEIPDWLKCDWSDTLLTSEDEKTSKINNTQIVESDFPAYDDVESLAADSVLVVMGQYGEEEPDVVNTAKDVENPLVESKDVYAECHVFTFHVQEVLKGDCSDGEIRVGLSYGIRPAGFSELAVKDTYLEPTTDDYKILFLLYSESDGFYYPTSQPYQLCFAQTASLSGTNDSITLDLDTSINGLNETFAIEADSLFELRELIG